MCQNRRKISRYRSGGTAFIIRNNLLNHITFGKSKSKLIQWLIIDKRVFNSDHDIFCANLYIPPIGTKYASDDPYLEIQNELFENCRNLNYLIIFGDFNSRTGQSADYTITDDFISNIQDDSILSNENMNILYKVQQCKLPLERRSADPTTNTYGLQMLEFCKSNDLFILNGRLGQDRDQPKTTCKDRSTIDYFIASAYVLEYISNLVINEFSSLFSDQHCGIAITLGATYQSSGSADLNQSCSTEPKIKLWDKENAHLFVNNIDQSEVLRIKQLVDECSENENVTKNDIDMITDGIENLFNDTCKETFGIKKPYTRKSTAKSTKPWFNYECKSARNIYHKTRRLYNRFKTDHYKNMLKIVSKTYKNVLSKNAKRFNAEKIEKLRNLKTRDPKEYWRLLNEEKQNKTSSVPINNFYQFFKTINDPPTTANRGAEWNMQANMPLNEEINVPINEAEIVKAAHSLKNNKSPGNDHILNEHIKMSLPLMLPIYEKLFNLVFDTAMIPESWLEGNILPIYKNKGDTQNPENYRPITLLSCVGKLFTSIINNRLTNYADKYDIITDSQTGFRHGFSTLDNLFVINTLIDMAKAKSKKLFCAFIDFKQAFDTVWREGLWQKLNTYCINGKCLKLLQNLYKNIKSRIKTHDGVSAFFPCRIGVRQGENLSPFLFAIFLNDLEWYFRQNNISGLSCEFNDEDLYMFIKIFILMYADDTVIFSHSQNDLQIALDTFENYCKEWRLTDNVAKTKIMVISRGRISRTMKFHYNNSELEIANAYKYLGIYLARSGSFNQAKKHIAEQANKALFSLLRKIRNLNLPYDLQIDLFNKTVKPILLYGSEIWGFGNIDVIERIQLKFLKYIFNLKKSTSSFMIYGELGIMPIYIDIKTRVISYWSKTISMSDQPTRLSYFLYKILYNMHKNKLVNSLYIENVKSILESCGFSGVWHSQDTENPKWLSLAISQKLKDQYLQTWSATVDKTSSATNFKLYKDTFGYSKFLSLLSAKNSKTFLRFRTRNHTLPVETGRWNGTPLHERICNFCQKELGDEFHFMLVCDHFKQQRQTYIKRYYYHNPNTLKFKQLMNTENIADLKKISCFIQIISNSCKARQ